MCLVKVYNIYLKHIIKENYDLVWSRGSNIYPWTKIHPATFSSKLLSGFEVERSRQDGQTDISFP